jgi:hypothetical protein
LAAGVSKNLPFLFNSFIFNALHKNGHFRKCFCPAGAGKEMTFFRKMSFLRPPHSHGQHRIRGVRAAPADTGASQETSLADLVHQHPVGFRFYRFGEVLLHLRQLFFRLFLPCRGRERNDIF